MGFEVVNRSSGPRPTDAVRLTKGSNGSLKISVSLTLVNECGFEVGGKVRVMRGTDGDAGHVAMLPDRSNSPDSRNLQIAATARTPYVVVSAKSLSLRVPDRPIDVPHRLDADPNGGHPMLVIDCRALMAAA